jgi:hypothetical protein
MLTPIQASALMNRSFSPVRQASGIVTIASANDVRKMQQARSTIMFTTLKTAAMAGLIGLTSLAALPAGADSLDLRFGERHDNARFGIYLGGGDRMREREFRHMGRRCTPERALDKAGRIGVRRARIDYVGYDSIGVVGRSRGERIRVTFARDRNCPVLSIG